jgi:two-component system, chemotaxis family, CheB/CheR fusion protein
MCAKKKIRAVQNSGGGRKERAASGKKAWAEEEKFAVVAIGASAGGIEAVKELLQHLPVDTGMGFVLVQHLDPHHSSMLTELLSRQTSMPVTEVVEGLQVKPNHFYVIPPNASMFISDHKLRLRPREESRGVPMPIDQFMRSLAEANGSRTIGIVLSGSGTDGTLGIAEIQAQGGLTFAQDEDSAKYGNMPRSAVGSGCVDYVMTPKQIARELTRIAKRYPAVVAVEEEQQPADHPAMGAIFQLLKRTSGLDFTHYRQTTILRRLQRRMVVHKMENLDDYLSYLQTNSNEVRALYQDMLINVTSFFRNAPVFDLMRALVFPGFMRNRPEESVVRVWTPACASGEETYSVAIALLEYLGEKAAEVPIQLFGTDVSEGSVTKARTGLYPENIQGDVSPERLKRYFNKVEGGYRVSKSVRDMCIFAQHNLLSDPPFSQMDLICCRNLLIYLEPVLQTKAISLFHYAARPNGYLVLGTSEGVGNATNLFTTQDRTYKIFSKKNTVNRPLVSFSLNRKAGKVEYGGVRTPMKPPDSSSNYVEAQREFDRRLVAQYSPATVFINDEMEIVHSRGNLGPFLKLAPGRASLSILKMAREGLLPELRNAIAKARKDEAAVRKHNVSLKNEDSADRSSSGNAKLLGTRDVGFEVVPIQLGPSKEGYFMIVFQEEARVLEIRARNSKKEIREVEAYSSRLAKLEQELGATKEYLQSVIETQEATNEELQSANEEILSSNEELQSTNEELETAKEELQSTNEELSTVNDELRNRNVDILTANNDLTNLLASIEIAVVMLGPDVTIRRFTPQAQTILGLIPADVGRPFLNINPLIQIPDLQQMVLKVIGTSKSVEKEVRTAQGELYQLRILPYRTPEGKLEGAVLMLVDIGVRDGAVGGGKSGETGIGERGRGGAC